MCDATKVFNPLLPVKEVEKTCVLVAWVSPEVEQVMYLLRSGLVPTLQRVKHIQRGQHLDPIRCDLEWGDIEIIRYRPEIGV